MAAAMTPVARRIAGIGLGIAGGLSGLWYFREVALVTSGKRGDASLVLPAILTLTCTMLALYMRFRAAVDED